jgi:hypothetical protein
VMQLYMSCKQRKTEMAKDLDRLKEENKRLENRSTTVSTNCTFEESIICTENDRISFIIYFFHTSISSLYSSTAANPIAVLEICCNF